MAISHQEAMLQAADIAYRLDNGNLTLLKGEAYEATPPPQWFNWRNGTYNAT